MAKSVSRSLNSKSARSNKFRVGSVLGSLFVIVGALVLPTIAWHRRGVDFRWTGYAFILSALTYWVYAKDKRRAEQGEWRVPEAQLHFLELLGGWPGAFLAQRILRHKCSKGSYQAVFWLIVLIYQFLAFDSLQNWRFSDAALNRFTHRSQNQKG